MLPLVVALAVLAGCSLQTSLTGGTSGPAEPRPTTTSASTGPTVRARDAEADRPIAGNVDCSDRAAYMEQHRESCDPREPVIVGLSVDAAKQKIAATNASLKIKVVEQYEFDKDCKADHVCGFEPRRWYVGDVYEVRLAINRKLNLGPPED